MPSNNAHQSNPLMLPMTPDQLAAFLAIRPVIYNATKEIILSLVLPVELKRGYIGMLEIALRMRTDFPGGRCVFLCAQMILEHAVRVLAVANKRHRAILENNESESTFVEHGVGLEALKIMTECEST